MRIKDTEGDLENECKRDRETEREREISRSKIKNIKKRSLLYLAERERDDVCISCYLL